MWAFLWSVTDGAGLKVMAGLRRGFVGLGALRAIQSAMCLGQVGARDLVPRQEKRARRSSLNLKFEIAQLLDLSFVFPHVVESDNHRV